MATCRTSILKKPHSTQGGGSRSNSRRSLNSSSSSRDDGLDSLSRQISQRTWVEKTFQKRDCSKFIPSHRDNSRCCCGRTDAWHSQVGLPRQDPGGNPEKWHPYKHTQPMVTDAYGTIEFQGGPHPSKAQYIRLSSLDSRQENVLTLLIKYWGLDLPKLLITVHGGILNFDLQPKLKRVFRKGLLKAARTTGAWIVTNGTNTGVTKHVGDAISDRTTKARNKVIAIGIAPWGIVENKEDLIGRDIVVPYHCVSSTKTNASVLNSNHSYFLLADNGTTGKYGGEVLFRKKFEKNIANQKIHIANDFRGHGVPVICVVLEGGANTVRSVLEYVTDTPPVPVVVCDGSGRAADLLAFTHKYTMDDGTMAESLRDQLIHTIQHTFQYTLEQAEKLFIELMLCVKKKELITVFRMGDREESKDIDLAILTALLKGTTANAIDQLNLALTWDRVDIARSHIFVYGQEWPEGALEVAMMDALINDRVDFVKLLLENGVSMHTFLTMPRLEELYNTRKGPSNTLRYLVRDVKKSVPSSYSYTLPDIGLVLQHLMGGGFRCNYCRKRFRQKYHALKQNGTSVGNIVTSVPHLFNTKQVEELFPYPFHDLMIWAVLMKRQKMALFMWQHGEEALAKALLAGKLYRSMALEADQDDLEIELSEEFRSYANEFLTLSLELLEHCYKIDDDYTQQLLTYELKNFSEQTCLGLAVIANHRQFIAHTCCQVLLNDLWIGGLRMRKNTSLKVMLGILFPPYIFALEFKSKEELQLMPQTMEEHLDELEDAASEADLSMSSFSEDQEMNNYYQDDQDSVAGGGGGGGVQNSPVKENGSASHNTLSPLDKGRGGGGDNSIFSFHTPFRKKKSPLRMGKKVYEFYNAPITKFWAHAIGYVIFLLLFGYVILERLKEDPNWAELYIIAVIFTMGLEKLRQIIASEPVKIVMKLHVYISQLWNILDTLGITLFLVGLTLRMVPATLRDAQLVYTVDIIFWNIRILEILSVNKYLGPYVKIIGKLLRDMCYFLTILFIAVTSFGLVRQSVHFQNQEVSWSLRLRNIWFYPYWMIYGELFADEIDPCRDPSKPGNSTDTGFCDIYAAWLAPCLMFVFLLVANILMVNLLIARFNATFIRNNANSMEIWMFQRYGLILQYEMRPILPPPFIIITHLYLAFKYIKRRCKGKRDFYVNGVKLFLSAEDTEKLHDFEEECMEDLYREKDLKFQSSPEERIRMINERVENMSLRLDDMNSKEHHLRLSLSSLDHRMSRLDSLEEHVHEAVGLLRRFSTTLSLSAGSQESLEDFAYQHPRAYSSSSSVDTGQQPSLPRGTLLCGEVERNQPSPMLVHSKQKTHSDQLKKFTNYRRRRQLSGSDYPLEESETGSFLGQNRAQSLSPRAFITTDSTKSTSNTATGEESATTATAVETSQKNKMRNFASQAVRFTEPVVHPHGGEGSEMSPTHDITPDSFHHTNPISVTTKLDSDTHTVISGSHGDGGEGDKEGSDDGGGGGGDNNENRDDNSLRQQLPTSCPSISGTSTNTNTIINTNTSQHPQFKPSRAAKLALAGQPLTINTTLASSLVTNTSTMPQSSAVFTSPNPDSNPTPIPQSAVHDLSSLLNPLISEYTSITDTIDTSCVEDISPPTSPSASAGIVFSMVDGFSDAEQARRKVKEKSAALTKQEALKQAEELEHQKMEFIIRHRLRQISQSEDVWSTEHEEEQDESGSISDIAKVVVAELVAEEESRGRGVGSKDQEDSSEIYPEEEEDLGEGGAGGVFSFLPDRQEEGVGVGEGRRAEGECCDHSLDLAIAAAGSSPSGADINSPAMSDIEEEPAEDTLLLYRNRVQICISQPSQDVGDVPVNAKFKC